MPRLENWSVVRIDPYEAPEIAAPHLNGSIYDDHRFPDGYNVTTSSIVDVKGNKVYTKSGTEYVLGTPSPTFIQWCKDNDAHIPTPDQPILWRDNT